MRIPSRRCRFCRRWFRPHPRTASIQKACSSSACRRERKTSADKAWRSRHQDYDTHRRAKVRAWAKAYPNYWRRYRAANPDYVWRDNGRRSSALRRARCSAKQDAIREIAVGKLLGIRGIAPETSAKQDAIFRRTEGLVDYLLWREFAAKHDGIAAAAPMA